MKKKPLRLEDLPPLPPHLMGDDKRSVILRAAHTIFLREGFTATSMDAVTKEAGVSKATVYAHFSSKQELFETLIRSGSEQAHLLFGQLIRSGGDPVEELHDYFETLLMLVLHRGYVWNRLVIGEAMRHPENSALFHECTLGRITTTVESYLGELVTEGTHEFPKLNLAARTLVSIILVGPLHQVLMLGPESVNFEESLNYGIELILSAGAREPKRAKSTQKKGG